MLAALWLATSPMAPLRAQQPVASASPKYVPPKECPPPDGFRAVLHLLDNNAPMLQMYPLPGLPLPKNMFAVFGEDMIPKCALERTYDDLARFKSEYARFGAVTPDQALTAGQLLKLGGLTYRGLKRWEWCLLLSNSKAPQYEYDGSQIPELKEGQDGVYALALEAGKKFIDGMTGYLARFKGVENDAVDAKKRLDEDEKRPKPRPAKEIAKDQAKVADYERRFRENGELMDMVSTVTGSYSMISKVHTLQKWCWPAGGDPAVTLAPMLKQLKVLLARIGGR